MSKGDKKTFTVLCADPAWAWKTYSKKGTKKAPKYETMSEGDLLALSPTIKDLAGKNAVMFLWGTRATLPTNLAVLATWGFNYKTVLVWKKPNVGTGYWSRDNAELVYIGVRGTVRLPAAKKLLACFEAPRREKRHSSKPTRILELIDEGYAEQRKIELFARHARDGWETYGGDLGTWITPTGIERRGNDAAGNREETARANTEHEKAHALEGMAITGRAKNSRAKKGTARIDLAGVGLRAGCGHAAAAADQGAVSGRQNRVRNRALSGA